MSDDSHRMSDKLQDSATRHYNIARDLAELLAVRYPAEIWQYLAAVFADIPALADEVARLSADLAHARLDRANLAAAALAVIAAFHDDEPDPLSYLRDELQAQGHAATPGSGA